MADRVWFRSRARLALHGRSVGIGDIHSSTQKKGKLDVQPKRAHEVVSIASGAAFYRSLIKPIESGSASLA